MCKLSAERSVAVLASSLLFAACAAPAPASARDVADANDTGSRVKTQNPADLVVLAELARLPSTTPRRLGNTTVVAEAPYSAASGQTCRAVHVTPPSGQPTADRLACSDRGRWFFVPDVFAGSGVTE